MPLPSSTPNCQQYPIFLVQGSLASNKRYIKELSWYLELENIYKFDVRIMTRDRKPNIKDTYNRMHVHRSQSMLSFHESFLDGAFLLPLISPDFEPTRHYFQGHPTSNIAYASHFNLRVVGHRGILDSYKYELRNNIGYWHNGTIESAKIAAKHAIHDFNKWCKHFNNSKISWGHRSHEQTIIIRQ
jgi:hypothetical protein